MSCTRVVGILAAAASLLLAGCAVGMQGPRPGAAPEEHEDIVHLRDSTELRGIIVERVPGTSLSLRARDGTEWILQESQIRGVEERSIASAMASGMPVVRMSDSALVRKWVYVAADGFGARVGRVLRIDGGTVVITDPGWLFSKTRIPRAAIANVIVSTSQSRKTGTYALRWGLGCAVFGGLSAWGAGYSNAEQRRAAVIGGTVCALVGAGHGALTVEHRRWRRLELKPDSTPGPVSSTGVAVGIRVRP